MPPIVPSWRSDDLVHVSVRKDHPRKTAPCPAQVEGAWASDLAIDEGEASFLKQAFSLLGSQGSIAIGDGIQMAVLIEGETVSKYEVDGAFN